MIRMYSNLFHGGWDFLQSFLRVVVRLNGVRRDEGKRSTREWGQGNDGERTGGMVESWDGGMYWRDSVFAGRGLG